MAHVKTFSVAEPYLKIDCGLGESPFWEEDLNQLRFVDIVKQKVHFLDLNKGPSSLVLHDVDISAGHTSDIENDSEHFVFGGKHGLGTMNRRTGQYEIIRKYWNGNPDQAEKEKKFRGNDGAVDARGRYWFGIIRDPLVNDPMDDDKCKTYQEPLRKADDDLQVSCSALILIYHCIGW